MLESRYAAGTAPAILGARLRMIEGQLSTFRQGFRVLGVIAQIRTALADSRKCAANPSASNALGLAKSLSMVPYFVADNLAWLVKSEALHGDKVALTRQARWCWFASLVFSTLSDCVAVANLAARRARLAAESAAVLPDQAAAEDASKLAEQRTALQTEARLLVLAYLKNGGDFVLATSQLGLEFSRPVTGFSVRFQFCLSTFEVFHARTELDHFLPLACCLIFAQGSLASFIGWYLVWPKYPEIK